ncbi:MAG TPA: hypothetical protein VM184_09060 [Gaiellaceae bacterium]|nr:hypothetical protein [Gaiellaceae bacterium]
MLTYPPVSGFDAAEHIEQARDLWAGRGLPEGSYTPPGFHLLAGATIEVAEALGADVPEAGGQLLNVLFALGTAALVAWLAHLVFPGRPVLRWAALAFFVCVPIVLKTTAMFHPQPLATFLITLALALCVRMVVQARYAPADWLALAATLAAAQLVRSVALWAVVAVLVTLVVAAVAQEEHRRRIVRPLAVAGAAIVLVPLPWYVYLAATGSNPVFGRATSVLRTQGYLPPSFYFSPGLPELVTDPHRGASSPRFLPILYSDTWGDYFGIWSWGPPRPELTPEVNRRLVLQNAAGLPLTALGLAGWVALALLTRRRWREAPAHVLVVLAPLLGLLAALYYGTRSGTSDGDTVKAMFLLPAVPFWALCFGFAADVLAGRGRRLAVPVLALLGACGLVCLTFAFYPAVS